MLARAKVWKNGSVTAAPIARRFARGRRIPRDAAAVFDRARETLRAAEAEAASLRTAARREAAEVRLRAEELGRAEGVAALASWSARLARAEAEVDERHLDRSIALATALAERLVQSALALDPALVKSLALEALRELRGTRRVRLVVHPSDAGVLNEALGAPPDGDAFVLAIDEALGRGDLRIETEHGVVDARLSSRLEVLGRHLREGLRR